MLFDAKILNKKVLAFVSMDKKRLVGYLEKSEIVVYKDNLYQRVLENFYNKKIIVDNQFINIKTNSIKVIIDELF